MLATSRRLIIFALMVSTSSFVSDRAFAETGPINIWLEIGTSADPTIVGRGGFMLPHSGFGGDDGTITASVRDSNRELVSGQSESSDRFVTWRPDNEDLSAGTYRVEFVAAAGVYSNAWFELSPDHGYIEVTGEDLELTLGEISSYLAWSGTYNSDPNAEKICCQVRGPWQDCATPDRNHCNDCWTKYLGQKLEMHLEVEKSYGPHRVRVQEVDSDGQVAELSRAYSGLYTGMLSATVDSREIACVVVRLDDAYGNEISSEPVCETVAAYPKPEPPLNRKSTASCLGPPVAYGGDLLEGVESPIPGRPVEPGPTTEVEPEMPGPDEVEPEMPGPDEDEDDSGISNDADASCSGTIGTRVTFWQILLFLSFFLTLRATVRPRRSPP